MMANRPYQSGLLKRPQLRPNYRLATNGLRIGLLGGTFDPPHAGHVAMSLTAMRELGLNELWWLVSPQNPLKSRKANSLEQRKQQARELLTKLAPGARIRVLSPEAQLGTTRTTQTLRLLRQFYPRNQFTWLMGADNLSTCHQWGQWQNLFLENRIAIFRRKCYHYNVMTTKAAIRFRRQYQRPKASNRVLSRSLKPLKGRHPLRSTAARIAGSLHDSPLLKSGIAVKPFTSPPPAPHYWTILHNRYHPASSSALRAGAKLEPTTNGAKC